jgi:hypothetical protein
MERKWYKQPLVTIALLVLCFVVVACGDEDDNASVQAPTMTELRPTPERTATPKRTSTPEPTKAPKPTATLVPRPTTTPCWVVWLAEGSSEDACPTQNGWTDDLWWELHDGLLDPLPLNLPREDLWRVSCYTDYTMVHYTPDEFLALDEERGPSWYDLLATLETECGSVD